ncbi:hypothetical protein EXIGLDRAFT_614489, partial [Exidia glandulosa HHB12029]
GQFTIDVYVSGYVANFTRPEAATRSQKALMYAARNYATLPKLIKAAMHHDPEPEPESTEPRISIHLSPSTEELLATKKLPPRPTEITDETERLALAQMYEDETATQFSEESLGASLLTARSDSSEVEPPPAMEGLTQDEVRQLHLNLHTRLRAFWSTPLSGRLVKLSLFIEGDADEPLFVQPVLTDAQGAFAVQIHVPWDRMLAHPRGKFVAHGDKTAAHYIRVKADLLPGPGGLPVKSEPDSVLLPLTYTRIRLISDMDDTVKSSEILHGARTVFRNVFVKKLDEVIIKEMSEWYQALYARGVRFHYVSNSPWELLPVLSEFITVSNLPQGSLKLKNYGGPRQFFSRGSEPAGVRKRQGVLEVLDAFLDAQFILVGDTGEQDMELYASLARDRPFQILAVFVRDVTSASILRKMEKDKEAAEAKRADFVERVRRAREMVPQHIAFRVFTDPAECVEAEGILDRLEIG